MELVEQDLTGKIINACLLINFGHSRLEWKRFVW